MPDLHENLARAATYLARFTARGVPNHIAGKPVPAQSGETFETFSPVDMRPLADVARSGATDVATAVSAAQAAFHEWSRMSGQQRRRILHVQKSAFGHAVVQHRHHVGAKRCNTVQRIQNAAF